MKDEAYSLSTQQPYAWLLTHATECGECSPYGGVPKTAECRGWDTGRRGLVFIHAGKVPDEMCYDEDLRAFCMEEMTINGKPMINLLPSHFPAGPSFHNVYEKDHCGLGGIVGVGELVDVVGQSEIKSPWFVRGLGQKAFIFKNVRPLPLYPIPGKIGLFPVALEPLITYYRQLTIEGLWDWTWPY